jgi:hypothetical protein
MAVGLLPGLAEVPRERPEPSTGQGTPEVRGDGGTRPGDLFFPNRVSVPDACAYEDPALTLTLISTWSLLTGRRLRTIDLTELDVTELIDFWADPQM